VGRKRNAGDCHDHITARTPQGRRATFLSGPPKVQRSILQWPRKAKWNRAKKRAGSQKIFTRAFNLAVMFRWLARIFYELLQRDHKDGRTTGQPSRGTAGLVSVPERYVAGADTRGRQEGRPYPWSQQVIHEISGHNLETAN